MHLLYAIAAVAAVQVSLEKQEHKAEAHKAEASSAYPAFEGTDTDALYGQAAGVDELHGAVKDVHERLGELLGAPRESGAILHPDSPLDHHERFLELLRGLGVKKETRDDLSAHAPDEEEPAKKEEPSEKKKAIGAMEKKALSQMGKSLKMMVMLHIMMQPLEKKLTAALQKMPPQSQQHTKDILSHVEKIDALSLTALALVNEVKKASHGTKNQKAKAIMKLMIGLAEIEKGVKTNLAAMKEETHGEKASPKMPAMTQKLHALLHKMEVKVATELKDPKRKGDPLVAIDVKMLQTMKAAVKKSEALVLVAALAMKKAKTDKERTKIKMAVSESMKKVMAKLKDDVSTLKAEAMVLASAKTAAAAHNAKQKAKAKKHDDDEEDAHDAEAGDVPPAPIDAPSAPEDASAKSDEGSASTYPEDGDKWTFEHDPKEKEKSHKVDGDEDVAPKDDEPKAAPSKADDDLDEDAPKDAEAAPKDDKPEAAPSKADDDSDSQDDPAMKTFKHGQNSFMKKLEEDLANLKKKFPKLPKMPPTPPAAHKKTEEAEHLHDHGYMAKLEADLNKWRDQGRAAKEAIEMPLAKIDAAIGADGKLSKLRKNFAAKMAQFQKEHDRVAFDSAEELHKADSEDPFLPSSELETAAEPDGVAELKAVAARLGKLAHDSHLRSAK